MQPAIGTSASIIAHAGGEVAGLCYSNSVEAVRASIERGLSAIELDVVSCRDGFIIAHDGMEHDYGLQSFGDVSAQSFHKQHMFRSKLTPASFDFLQDIAPAHPQVKFVLDFKESNLLLYSQLLDKINSYNLAAHVIPQSYRYSDVIACAAKGFRQTIFASWRHHAWSGPSEALIAELKKCKQIRCMWLGLSLRHLRWRSSTDVVTDDPLFPKVESLGLPIFFHALRSGSESELQRKGWGVYSS
jgi:hypothetical protein